MFIVWFTSRLAVSGLSGVDFEKFDWISASFGAFQAFTWSSQEGNVSVYSGMGTNESTIEDIQEMNTTKTQDNPNISFGKI